MVSAIFIDFIFYPESSLVFSGVQHLVLSYVFTFVVPCCDVRYDFRLTTMFGSFLPQEGSCRIYGICVICVYLCPTRVHYMSHMVRVL